jgi:hypothetical protein
LYTPPDGIGAMEAWTLAGAKGKDITICDIEGNWNRQHEDLPAGIQLIGGTVINDLGWRNHGTAVLGEMVSVSNAKGRLASAIRRRLSSTPPLSTTSSMPRRLSPRPRPS